MAATSGEYVSPLILPPPHLVADELTLLLGESVLWTAALITTAEILVSFTLATVLGLLIGFLVSRSVRLTQAVTPLMAWGYIFPFALLFPLFVMWFGVGVESKVAYALANAIFPIAFNTMRGLSNIEEKYLKLGKAFGASDRQIDWHIKIGGAWPMILSGIRVGAGMVTVTVILGEVLAADGGLGYEIQQSVNTFQIAKSYALIVFTIILTGILLWGMERIFRGRKYT